MKKKPLKKKRATLGKISSDLISKQSNGVIKTPTPNEVMREHLSDHDKELYACLSENKKNYIGDFYIVVITKKEKLMKNVLRSYFFARSSCPTPDYDQTLYRYNSKKDPIDFIWVVPDKSTCIHMIENKKTISPKQWELLSFVLKFQDNSLYRLAKELNGEEDKTSLIKT